MSSSSTNSYLILDTRDRWSVIILNSLTNQRNSYCSIIKRGKCSLSNVSKVSTIFVFRLELGAEFDSASNGTIPFSERKGYIAANTLAKCIIQIVGPVNAMLFVDKHFVDKHFVDRSSSTEFRRIFFRRQGSLSTGVLSTAGSSTDELVDIALGR